MLGREVNKNNLLGRQFSIFLLLFMCRVLIKYRIVFNKKERWYLGHIVINEMGFDFYDFFMFINAQS